MRTFKICIILSSLALSGGVLYTYATGQLYSGFSYGMLIATSLFLSFVWYSVDGTASSARPYIAAVVVLAVLYRTYVFLYPAGFIGSDPSLYAQQIEQTMQAGSTSAIELLFYSNVSAFISLPAMFGLMSGLPAAETLVIYPVFTGVVFTLAAVVLTRYLVPKGRSREGAIAAVVLSITTATTFYGYVPIAQTLAVALWAVLIFLSIQYYVFSSKRAFVLATLTLTGLAFAHKLPLPIVFVVLVALVSLIGLRETTTRGIGEKLRRHDRSGSVSPVRSQHFGVTLVMLSAIFLYFQWAFVTSFVVSVASTIATVLSTGPSVSPSLAAPTAAVAPQSEVVGILLRRAHGFALLSIGGLAWLFVVYLRRTALGALVLLVSSAVSVGFLFVSAFNPGTSSTSNPLRLVFFAEPVLVPIIAAVFGRVSLRRWIGALSAVLVVVLLVSQVYSATAVPDHPGGPREYLTTQEIEGKEFGYTYTDDPIYTDWYLTVTGPREDIDTEEPLQYRPLEEALLNGTVTERGYEYVSLRTNVDIYRTRDGSWRLTWNPETTLDGSYSRVYANGDLSLYANASTAAG